MKKLLLSLIFFALVTSKAFTIEDIFDGTVSLEDYFDLSNKQEYEINKVKKIKRLGAKELEQPKENNTKEYKDITLFGSASRSKNDFLNDKFVQNYGINYSKKHFSLTAGIQSGYDSPDALKSSKDFYFTPKIQVSNGFSLFLDNSSNMKTGSFQQEVGFKYSPSFAKNSSFGLSGGTKYYKDSTKSQKIKFDTDFYLW